ncbi:MmgE/PrpD family protein [Pelagibacterium limicola]|uniref:MmgE/PrpD family protein n=1 Tax=Pelagibacterium limicola TaxID=2791022 RepID=UPI0018AF5BD0|nr:MmgE/PrpD family protein [Pelagibacterium limicola]
MPFLARTLAAQAMAVSAGSIPRPVLEKARLCLFDYFSSAYEARTLPWSQQAIARLMPGAEGAAAIALGSNVAPADAAFANAVAAHGLVREDMHTASVSHLGIVVWPALLADLAQPGRVASGRDLLAAAIVGYQAGARLGQSLMTAELSRLFRPTGLIGPFAAVTAIAHLRGLTVEQTASAMALAINCSAGLNQWPTSGGSDMYFHAGFAARNALLCADLAEAGAFGSPDVIEGEAGLFAAFARRPLTGEISLFPNDFFEICSVFHKPAPACNFAQTPSQAALEARLALGAPSNTITAVRVGVTRAAMLYPGCDSTGPFANLLQAKMSIQFGVAAALARGVIESENYADLDDGEIARLIAVTTLVENPDYSAAFPARQPASVSITCADGRIVDAVREDIVPANEQMVIDRFLISTQSALGDQGGTDLYDFVRLIADADDALPLNALQMPRVQLVD